MTGRFDYRYELESIYRGMDRDLHQVVGQILPWYVFDNADTTTDSVYDVGSGDRVGRTWYDPLDVPTLSIIKVEANVPINKRGLYPVDTLNVVISPDALRLAGLDDILANPDLHAVDRLVYEGKVFGVEQIRVRGAIKGDYDYVVVGVDARQIKRDELYNDDPYWQQFLARDAT